MKRNITTETIIQIAGFVLIIAGIVVAFLNGQAIITAPQKAPDYLMIGGLVVYMVGRQMRIKRQVTEEESDVIDVEDIDKQ